MAKDFAYIGDTLLMSLLYESLLGSRTRQFALADQGLEAITNEKFSLIVVDDILAAGDLDLPPGVSIGTILGLLAML